MTGRMTLPKAESWWMKKPRLVLLADSRAVWRWPEVRWPPVPVPSVAEDVGTYHFIC